MPDAKSESAVTVDREYGRTVWNVAVGLEMVAEGFQQKDPANEHARQFLAHATAARKHLEAAIGPEIVKYARDASEVLGHSVPRSSHA